MVNSINSCAFQPIILDESHQIQDFVVLPRNDEGEFEEFFVLPKKEEIDDFVVISEEKPFGLSSSSLSDSDNSTKNIQKTETSAFKANALFVAQNIGMIAHIPKLPEKVKENVIYASAALDGAHNITCLYDKIKNGPESRSMWERAKYGVSVANLGYSLVNKAVILGKPFIPALSTAVVPGGALIHGVFTGLSILSTAMNAADYLEHVRKNS